MPRGSAAQKESAPAPGRLGPKYNMPGREEKTDTLSALVVGHQVPNYIMVYEAPQLVCSRGMAGRTCEAAEALVINNGAGFCSAPLGMLTVSA
jgi:hypothetical protein